MGDLRPVYVAGGGDVKGPANSSNNFLPLFADTTGKLLKSSETGVTTQGLAILDDNTPAEQRNTIGLDQVNNTSDINKPVSTAQHTALNRKMNLTGDGAAPRLGAVFVNSSGLDADQQGAYLFWNETGDGRASLINNQGGGIGGFKFRTVNNANTVETGSVTIDGSGSLSSTGSITAAGSIYGANGAVTVGTSGDVNGSVWGGWLSSYIANYVKTNVPLVSASQGASGGVGTYALLYAPSQTKGPGWLVSGNSLAWASAEGTTAGGIVGIGTWRLMGYINAASSSYGTSLFLRVS